ncbi:hypothetical protein Taro_004016 [Colocasia esculenta]|uniref:Uncharacterized protein n=1 Tax=Colocasia esculenta TaxID=4460 RepID=A0A843TL08_COLES|nr:hypothetical protein [Colocasia esculenta]
METLHIPMVRRCLKRASTTNLNRLLGGEALNGLQQPMLKASLVRTMGLIKLLDWGEEENRKEAEIASLRSAFTQEVVVWRKLDRPNVTKFTGAIMGTTDLKIKTETNQLGMPSNICCVVVEYLPGKNWRKKLTFKLVVKIAMDLARGSYFYELKMDFAVVAKFLVSYQHWMFYLVMCFARISLLP